MATLRVPSAGMLTTIQDQGRWGWQSYGVPVAGPMDPWSHRWANALVQNMPTDATLELTLVGPTLEFDDERVAAVAGADCDLRVDDRPVPTATAFAVKAGSSVRIGACHRGARAYVAVSGGIAVPPIFGSRATHLVTHMGGFEGRGLRDGDRLPLGPSHSVRRAGLFKPAESRVRKEEKGYDPFFRIRVLPGPQQHRFVVSALDILESQPFVIDAESDRMGYRLIGPPLMHDGPSEMISDATSMGALQVPAAGSPILLMADRQTTGGYPSIATVITADIGMAGQLRPGDSVRFVLSSRREAMAALIARERAYLTFESESRT